MKLRRQRRNVVERETVRVAATVGELRHHSPFGAPELMLMSDAMLARLRVA